MPSLLACEYSCARECNTRHTCVRASNERTQYTRTRIYSVYTQASPTPKESGGLGYKASVSTARASVSACVFEYSCVLARVPAWACASTRVYSCEYTCVRVRVLVCDSRATREGCQVAREQYMYIYRIWGGGGTIGVHNTADVCT